MAPRPLPDATSKFSMAKSGSKRSASSVSTESPPSKEKKAKFELVLYPVEESASRALIEERFKLNVPAEFFAVWSLARKLDEASPLNAFAAWGLQLVGPFEVLARDHSGVDFEEVNDLRWRHWHDPMEFTNCVQNTDKSRTHIGYVRDDPTEVPTFVARADDTEHGFRAVAEGLLPAIAMHIEKVDKKLTKAGAQEIIDAASGQGRTTKAALAARQKAPGKLHLATFSGIGLVVPFDKVNDLGYRDYGLDDRDLKKLLAGTAKEMDAGQPGKQREEWDELGSCVSFANDECDFGMGLHLGANAYSHGSPQLRPEALRLMGIAYKLLGRVPLCDIARTMLTKKGPQDCPAALAGKE